jgi:hypothetical protein
MSMKNLIFALVTATVSVQLEITPAHGGEARHALDSTPIAECLGGWNIQWRLPYYPQLKLRRCKAEKSAVSSVANAPTHRLTAEFGYSIDAFPQDSAARIPYSVPPQALYAHFDRLLTHQGFARVDGPLTNIQEPTAPYPEWAAYERAQEGGMVRVEYSIHISSTMTILLEKYGPTREAAKLPSPTANLDLTEPGVHGRLFAMPDAALVDERLTWEQHNFTAGGALNDASRDDWHPVDVPSRQFRYRFKSKISSEDALSAWHIALKQAGWKAATSDNSLAYDGKRLSYQLPGRTLELSLTAWTRNDATEIVATLADPTLWQSIVGHLRLMDWAKPWEIEPQFDAGGKPTPATRLKLFALSSRTASESGTTLLIVPVVEPSQANSKDSVQRAHKAARWVRDEMLRVGIFLRQGERQPTNLAIHPDPKPPLLQKFGVAVGARVTYRWCRTITDRRPDRIIKRCECNTDQSGHHRGSGPGLLSSRWAGTRRAAGKGKNGLRVALLVIIALGWNLYSTYYHDERSTVDSAREALAAPEPAALRGLAKRIDQFSSLSQAILVAEDVGYHCSAADQRLSTANRSTRFDFVCGRSDAEPGPGDEALIMGLELADLRNGGQQLRIASLATRKPPGLLSLLAGKDTPFLAAAKGIEFANAEHFADLVLENIDGEPMAPCNRASHSPACKELRASREKNGPRHWDGKPKTTGPWHKVVSRIEHFGLSCARFQTTDGQAPTGRGETLALRCSTRSFSGQEQTVDLLMDTATSTPVALDFTVAGQRKRVALEGEPPNHSLAASYCWPSTRMDSPGRSKSLRISDQRTSIARSSYSAP